MRTTEQRAFDLGNYPRTLAELEALPDLGVSQADSLKFDDGTTRVWLSRCGVADGEPYPNKVTVEVLRFGRWREIDTFPAVQS